MATEISMLTKQPRPDGSCLIKDYVWELPVRLTHWVVVLCVLVLAATGFYMHNPFIFVHGKYAYLMGTVRFIHVLMGFVLTAALLVRFYWFFAGNRCASWRAFLPVRKKQWREMGQMIRYYSFLRREPLHKVGHNPLAASFYTLVLLALLGSVLTGFTLFSTTAGTPILKTLFGWIGTWIGIQSIRLIHYLLMFAFLAFMIHHVYSAILVSIEERNGLLESIVTGYKYIPEWEWEESECARKGLGG
jgi:Ni/Fe-hydrogenase 1 B-type cytochrome subunit